MSFAVTANHRVKIKEDEKRENIYTMTVIPVVVSALGTILKGLVKRLEDLEIRRQV